MSHLNLFSNISDSTLNILPKDGIVNYFGPIFSEAVANSYLNSLLLNVDWKNDEAFMFGKLIVTKRKVAWYGDNAVEYTYSNRTKKALPWTNELLALKTEVELKTGEQYNSCLINVYHSGEEGMGWHSDGEKDLKKDGAIGSLSFGAERKFSFKHNTTKETVSLLLEHGSLLVMKGTTQTYWMHRLPPTKKTITPRVNLTFRTIVK